MPKSEKLKQRRAMQVAAAKLQFEAYKEFIVKEFVEKFGGSYQTPETMKDIWRDSFIFRPECEKFLLKKTQIFLLLLEDKQINRSPCFLRTLIGLIAEYLSKYICKKGISRNTCTQQLINILFTNNCLVQKKTKNYQKEIVASQKQPKVPAHKRARHKSCEKVAEAVHKITQRKANHTIMLKIYISELVK